MKYIIPLILLSFASFGQEEITVEEQEVLDIVCTCTNEALEDVNYYLTTILNYIKEHPEDGLDFEDEDLLAELTEKQAAEYHRQEELFDSILDTDEIDLCIEDTDGFDDVIDTGMMEGRTKVYIAYLHSIECYGLETIFRIMMYDY